MPLFLTGVGVLSSGSGPSAGSGLLLESSPPDVFLLLEDGSFLLLES